MTLATRVIGTLLVDGGTGMLLHRVGFRTVETRGYPVAQANVYAYRSMDEILMLDVTATEQGREPDHALIADVVGSTFLPVSYGGGVTSVEQAVRIVAGCGADKIVLTPRVGWQSPSLGEAIAMRLGSQAVMVCLNYVAGMSIVTLAREIEGRLAGEILVQSIDRDGTLAGYDLDLIRAVSSVVAIPVIASSGCGKPADMVDAIRAGASAVAAGWMWNATDARPAECKRALAEAGYVVRPTDVAA